MIERFVIESTDTKFLSRLIKWLNTQEVKDGSTTLYVHTVSEKYDFDRNEHVTPNFDSLIKQLKELE